MHVVTVHDPFHPLRGREVRELRKSRSIARLAPKTDKPFVMLVDGKPVLRQDWGRKVGGDQVVVIFMLPQGGGGSNPLRIIGMLAIVAASFVLGPIVGGFLGSTLGIGATAAAAIGSSLVMFGGSMLLNAIVPPPTANAGSLSSSANVPTASPTYSLQAQGNAARLGNVIPVQYGRLRVYPDFAAQPYVEYSNNEQYLYQLLCVGQGEYSIESVQINDSPITSFANVEYEVVLPGSKTALFPANVTQSAEVSGQTLGTQNATYSLSGTTLTVTATAHGLSVGNAVYLTITSGGAASGSYTVTAAPTADTFTVTAASGSTSGGVRVGKTIGPFVANGTSTVCKYIGIDLVAPRGMYYANDNGGLDSRSANIKIEAQEVDQSGTAIGNWVTLGTETISGATTTAIRKSFKYAAPSSAQTYPRYRVRCTRTDLADTSSRAGDEIAWSGMRVYMPDTTDYGNVTLLAVRAQATNNLSSMSARQINVVATRKIKTVTVSGLSATTSATRSLAAALADIATNTVYGGGIASANIDWVALYALEQTLAARGDYLDVRFDSATTLWEALTQAGVVARTKPFMQGGVLHFVRDQAQTMPVALFSMRNIVQNSMSINYLTPTNETSDSVQVTYFDKTTWQQTTVSCVLSGSAGANPAKISLLGVTERDQAFREGLYQSAANKYRRKVIKFSTEAEGFIPAFGDLIAIQHDMPAWGQQGEVTGWAAGTKMLTVNEALTWKAGSTHYAGLRKRDGSIAGPYQVTRVTDPQVLKNGPGATQFVYSNTTLSGWAAYFEGATITTGQADPTGGNNAILLEAAPPTTPGWTRGVICVGPPPVSKIYTQAWMKLAPGSVGNAMLIGTEDYGSTAVTLTNEWQLFTVVTDNTGGVMTEWRVFQVHPASDLTTKWFIYAPTTSTNPSLQPTINTTAEPMTIGFDVLQLATSPSFTPYTGMNEERTHIAFGPGDTWRQPARVVSVQPRGPYQVEITAVNEDASVHTADQGRTAPALAYSQLPTTAPLPMVSGLRLAIDVTGAMPQYVASWDAAPGADHYVAEISFDNGTTWAPLATEFGTSHRWPANHNATASVRVAAVNIGRGNWATASVSYASQPATPTGFTSTVNLNQLALSWAQNVELDVIGYEVRTADTGWGTAGAVFSGYATGVTTNAPSAGASQTFYLRAFDFLGNYSASSATVTFTAPSIVNIGAFTASFFDTSATSATVTLTWANVAPDFGLRGYQVSYGSTVLTTSSNTITLPADWIGDRAITVRTIDQLGNLSSGYTQTVNKQAPASPTGLRVQVIDNTVMLYWSQPAVTTLPISHYLLRRGSTWAASDVDYGRKDGLFTTVMETAGGTYTYWVATVDTDGYVSTPVSVSAVVAQPPDFVLYGSFNSTFSGTKSSAFLENGAVLLPVNTTETWASHFTARSWASPQDQINAGYPVFIQPSSSPGYYEETFDFGTVLASSRVSAAYSATTVAGSPTITPTISTSANGTTWLDNAGQNQIFATNFRYVKVRIAVADVAGTGIVSLNSLAVTLDAKLKTDAGSIVCSASDASGTVANFSTTFVDVASITLTPQSTTPVTAVYDFLDSVIAGTYSVTSNVCTVNATAHGLVVGQNVRLSFTSGTAPSGVYTVTSVVSANSYTVALTTANTSGNVSTYPEGMRIYLFNSAGSRVSGTASWSIRGT